MLKLLLKMNCYDKLQLDERETNIYPSSMNGTQAKIFGQHVSHVEH